MNILMSDSGGARMEAVEFICKVIDNRYPPSNITLAKLTPFIEKGKSLYNWMHKKMIESKSR